MLLNSLISDRPTAAAKFTGTFFLFSTNIKCKVKNIFYIKVVYIYFLYLFMKDIIRQLLFSH